MSGRVVIIGAGIVGCSLADELTARGCTDVVVLEQGPLFATGGSTSHAPGGMHQTNFAQFMTNFAQYSVQRYKQLELDGQPCFHPVGGIEVAGTAARWLDLKRKHGVATAWGVESHLIGPEECARIIPLIDPRTIVGASFYPTDGVAKPVRAAEAMARLAMGRGAVFHGDCELTGITVKDGRVRGVTATAGDFAADIVVSCAGIWGPRIGRMAGVPVPLVPMQHQYTISTPLAELRGETRELVFPVMRHQDADLYFRQHADRYGVGSYAHRPLPISADDLVPYREAEVMPSVLPFTPGDFEPARQDARELMPALRDADIESGINGVFSFTVDGFPLLGESRAVRGLWLAEAIWITHAAGAARAVAEWIVDGVPSVDLRLADIERFEPFMLGASYVRQRSNQAYIEVYDVKHPLEPMGAPREVRVSPFYPREKALGGVFLEAAGWERPQWYEANAPLVEGRPIPDREPWSARFWSPIVGAEHLVTRERVGLYDMQSLTKVEVTGPNAPSFLQHLTTGNMDRRVGTVTYTLMLDHHAGVKSDITVARLGPDRFQIGCNGPRDIDWFERNLPPDGSVQVHNVTGGRCCLGVWGPRARDLVQRVTDADVSESAHRYFQARTILVGDVPVTAMRLSYVGELGWELYTSADHGLHLWDLLWEAGQEFGVIAGGRGAFDCLRVEKGYRFWGRDMWTEHDPYEAGVGFAVNLDKGDFVGREALLRRRQEGPRQRLVCLSLGPADVVMGSEPVYAGDHPVGFVTSAAYGYSVGHGVVYAWVLPEWAAAGTPLTVEYFGERLAAMVTPEPLFDPDMLRMREPSAAVRVRVAST
jgi:glycine cleavage system aminomethyltransferase T/glycine/D-amino acid oxidase-like deaminating enzyme